MIKWGFLTFKANAQKCYDELIDAYGEEFTAEQVLELARDPSKELHKCFDWNDATAAEKWRLHQARQICGSLTVVIERENKGPREFRIIQHDNAEKVYRPVMFTVRDEDRYARLLSQAKADMKAFKSRYAEIVELQSVIEEIERVL